MNSPEPAEIKTVNTPGKLPAGYAAREGTLIDERRAAAGYTEEEKKHRQKIGVALSGGGIRSATFCLGLFQSLAQHGLLRHVDFLSTVSGGGYFGGFLGRMFTRDWVITPPKAPPEETAAKNFLPSEKTAAPPETPAHPNASGNPRGHRSASRKMFLAELRGEHQSATRHHFKSDSPQPHDAVARVETALIDSQSPPLIWLRESSNYLAPGGANDAALDTSIYLRNWFSMLVVILTSIFTVFAAFNCLRFSIGKLGGWGFETLLANHAGAHLWWTPAIALPVLAAAIFLVPLGMAYWLTQTEREARAVCLAYLLIVVAGVVGFWHLTGDLQIIAGSLAIIVLLAILWLAGFDLAASHSGAKNSEIWIRNRMARWLRVALLTVVGTFIFALIDSWGQSLYAVVSYAGNWHKAAPAIGGILGITTLAPLVRSLILKGAGTSGKFKVPLQFLALFFSVLLALIAFTTLAFVSHGLAWKWNLPRSSINDGGPGGRIYNQWCAETNSVKLTADHLIQVVPAASQTSLSNPQPEPDRRLLWATFAVSGLLSFLLGRTVGFLNLSSYHTLYSSRITRAYQGASDDKRWEADADVTLAESDDDIDWNNYRPHAHGGPLHLINCTINCTESVETAMESTTAKGLNLCVGPAGISYGQHHAVFSQDCTKVTPFVDEKPADKSNTVEALALGDWVGISGAAFTTGLGNVGSGCGTTLGTSLLCGLFNVRLGYWWENNFSPSGRASFDNVFPVQTYFADEFTASFHLVKRDHWYLSDGGHLENTAAYELIRRRVELIILADCGADPNGIFDDLGNLARRVRIDFGAEIKFLNAAEIEAKLRQKPDFIGSLGDLQPSDNKPLPGRLMKKHAAIAEVHYPEGGTPSTILVIKPGLTGDEPEDLINYQLNNDSFPQQSTSQQFYDEAQWESYRKLGEHTMDSVLKGGWLKKELSGK